jgi:hypothetical protein
MALEAVCPNGHKILCPDDRAGRVARCPKCGLAYRIPEPGATGPGAAASQSAPPGSGIGQGTAAVVSSDPTVSQASAASGASDSAIFGLSGLSSSPASPEKDDLFLFLCPNKHKLHGSKRMAGKVGRCPQCNMRFEIPQPSETEVPDVQDDTVTEDPLLHADQGGSSGALNLPPLDEGDEAPLINQTSASMSPRSGGSSSVLGGAKLGYSIQQPKPQPGQVVTRAIPAPITGRSPASGGHPLAVLVARLWAEREHGGIVELHLRGGALLTPEWFDERLSRGDYGLFAAPSADGTVSMTVVPWEEVTRVIVRGVVGIPDGLFE